MPPQRRVEGGRLELVTGREHAGARLDVMLGSDRRIGSRARAQRLVDGGRVAVDGRRRPKGHRLEPGERVVVDLADGPDRLDTAGGGEVPHEVIFEDDHLIVVDKPAGVVVHPAPGHPTGTLVQALSARAAGGSEPWRPGVVHRLDRDTSGLLVVAKSDPVHRALQRLIRVRALRREYRALIDGRPGARSGTIDAALGRDRTRRDQVSTRTDRPRAARTHFSTLESLARTTLLALRLETGRTHQIRAHLSAIGHPVCGDARYGGKRCGERIGLDRQFLHSARLGFDHPISGQALVFESDLPADLRRALEAARADAARR